MILNALSWHTNTKCEVQYVVWAESRAHSLISLLARHASFAFSSYGFKLPTKVKGVITHSLQLKNFTITSIIFIVKRLGHIYSSVN